MPNSAYEIVRAYSAAELNTAVTAKIAAGKCPIGAPRVVADYDDSGTLKTKVFYQAVADTTAAAGVTHYQVLGAESEGELKTLVDTALAASWKPLGTAMTVEFFTESHVPKFDEYFQAMYKGVFLSGDAGEGGGGGTPAGAEGPVQYNDDGAFGASAAFTYDVATKSLLTPALILPGFYDDLGIKVNDTWNVGVPVWGWRDITGDIKTRTGGGTAPTFAAYYGNIYQFSMTTSGEKEVFNEFHIPHDYVPNSPMFIHVHWSTAAAPTGSVIWDFEVSYAKGFDQDQFNTPLLVRVKQAASQAYQHMVAEVQFAAPNGEIHVGEYPDWEENTLTTSINSGSTTLNLSDGTGVDESYVGRAVRIKGAGVAGADLDTTIVSIGNTIQWTLANPASTTLTGVAGATKFILLSSARVQVDGMILARTSRNAAATGDNLDVAPFLHTVDVHYQSTNMATSQKRPPFYDEYPS